MTGDDELDDMVGESRAKLTTAVFKRNQMNKSTSRIPNEPIYTGDSMRIDVTNLTPVYYTSTPSTEFCRCNSKRKPSPCEKFKCDKFDECAKKVQECFAFRIWVNTGKFKEDKLQRLMKPKNRLIMGYTFFIHKTDEKTNGDYIMDKRSYDRSESIDINGKMFHFTPDRKEFPELGWDIPTKLLYCRGLKEPWTCTIGYCLQGTISKTMVSLIYKQLLVVTLEVLFQCQLSKK